MTMIQRAGLTAYIAAIVGLFTALDSLTPAEFCSILAIAAAANAVFVISGGKDKAK